jgi:hypothetical protein
MTRLQGQPPCHLACLQAQAHLIFLGGVGLGHTHVATALGSAACLKGYAVLCASAMDGINPLAAAKSAGRLTPARRTYPKPALLLLDELGYLPMDQAGADLLCHVLSLRDEQGAIIMTSHRAFKEWPTLCNPDRTLTAAMLDRLLPHAETVVLEGSSFRLQDQREPSISLPQSAPEATMAASGDTFARFWPSAFSRHRFFSIFTQSLTLSPQHVRIELCHACVEYVEYVEQGLCQSAYQDRCCFSWTSWGISRWTRPAPICSATSSPLAAR